MVTELSRARRKKKKMYWIHQESKSSPSIGSFYDEYRMAVGGEWCAIRWALLIVIVLQMETLNPFGVCAVFPIDEPWVTLRAIHIEAFQASWSYKLLTKILLHSSVALWRLQVRRTSIWIATGETVGKSYIANNPERVKHCGPLNLSYKSHRQILYSLWLYFK